MPLDDESPLAVEKKPHPVVVGLFWLFLVSFFGGGLAVFVHLFIPFLSEAAFAIIALVLLAEFVVLWVAGKAIEVFSFLRQGERD